MKLFNLIWVLALAVAGLACDNWTDQAVVDGCKPGHRKLRRSLRR